MVRKDYTTTTITIQPDYIKWIEENSGLSVSAYVRKLVCEQIEKTSSFDAKIKEIDDRIKASMREIEALQLQREELTQEHARIREENMIREASALIAKAINKLPYISWQDAANDLESSRGDISSETFLDLVQTIWVREHDGVREDVPTN